MNILLIVKRINRPAKTLLENKWDMNSVSDPIPASDFFNSKSNPLLSQHCLLVKNNNEPKLRNPWCAERFLVSRKVKIPKMNTWLKGKHKASPEDDATMSSFISYKSYSSTY